MSYDVELDGLVRRYRAVTADLRKARQRRIDLGIEYERAKKIEEDIFAEKARAEGEIQKHIDSPEEDSPEEDGPNESKAGGQQTEPGGAEGEAAEPGGGERGRGGRKVRKA